MPVPCLVSQVWQLKLFKWDTKGDPQVIIGLSPNRFPVRCLNDTGAQISCFPSALMATLGISPHARVRVQGVGGQPLSVPTTWVVLHLPDEQRHRRVKVAFVPDLEQALLGMDALAG